ncbi:hypothetical protein BDV25DRAFT_162006 [Aspergillus avenaceus]|uniref:Uncharacterized protein n=1 Tax=Aspergillus avenaceus TaxID=36643 RepID=A0A5N6TKS9_ASPAV|nr:hypothetical protein BDV25DRAFT_162006 [Aspergillus avenaceus]
MSTLFNTGLKALLLDTIPRVSGSAMARETKLLSLSRIAPPVFSPGYREVSSQPPA